MTPLLFAETAANNTKIAVAVGALVFIILFFKLIVGFIKFCFRHPFIFILLLLCGGLGFMFNFLLAGIGIIAVIVGGIVLLIANSFDQ